MKGQSSAELLILVAAILMSVTATFYLCTLSNEGAVVMRAARDGAENAIATIDDNYGCSIDIDNLIYSAGTITINVVALNVPPGNIGWDNFRENVIENKIREGALLYVSNAIGGSFPHTVQPVKTAHYTYDVAVEVRRVTI